MAQKVQIEFDGGGGLLADVDALYEAITGLSAAHKRVHDGIRADLDKTSAETQSFNKDIDTTVKVVTELGKAGTSIVGAGLGKGLKDASGAAKTLQTEVDKVRKITGVAQDSTAAFGRAAKRAGTEATAGLREVSAAAVQTQRQVQQSVQLTAEQYDIIRQELQAAGIEGDELAVAMAEVVQEVLSATDAASLLDEAIAPAEEQVKGLKQQLRDAVKEANRLAAEFGIDSEQAVAAQKRVAALKDEVGDLSDRFTAFNPDAKFEAFNRAAFAASAGLGAVQGALGLIAGENEALNKVLSTLQVILFTTTGLNDFFSQFPDALKTVRVALLGTTAATEASTAAAVTNAGAVAATGNAAKVSAGGFNILTTSVRAFLATLLTNPIFLGIAAIAALGVALLSTSDDAERLKKSFDGLMESAMAIQRIDDAATDLSKGLADLDIERRKINVGDKDFKAQAALAKESADEELKALKSKEESRRKNVKSLNQELDQLSKAGELTREEYRERSDAIAEIETEATAFANEQLLVKARLNNELLRIDKAATESAREAAKERRDASKAANEDILALQIDLANRLRQAQIERAGETDPRVRIDLERETAQAEINELEIGFKRKLAAIQLQRRIGVQAFRELSESERNARLDALIKETDIQLPAKQQEQINALRLLADEKYFEELDKLYNEQAAVRIQLIEDLNERERAEFQQGLDARIRDLKKAGATDIEVRAFSKRETEAFERKKSLDAIDLDEQLNTALVNARKNNGELEKEFQRRKEVELLQIQITAAEARLKVLAGANDKESVLLRSQTEATLLELTKAKTKLENTPINVNLYDLLGIAPEEQAAVRQSLQQFASSVISIFNTIYSAQQEAVAAQIQATEALVQDAQNRRTELEAELDKEVENNRRGLASNVANVRSALAENARAEQEAVRRQRELQQEQERIARKQAAIQAITQTANIASAAAQVIAANSGTIPTLIAALAAAAALVATFASIKSDAASVSRRQYREGGILQGPSHESGGLGIYDERSGTRIAEAEGGEGFFFINRATSQRRRGLLEALNADDMGLVAQRAIEELAASNGIRLEADSVHRVMENREFVTSSASPSKMADPADEIRNLRRDVNAIYDTLVRDRPSEMYTAKGVVRREGKTTRRIR